MRCTKADNTIVTYCNLLQPSAFMENTLLTAKQVQELLHIDRTTVYRMLKDGRLSGVKVGQQWRFSSREVNQMLSGATRPTSEFTVSTDVLPLHCMQPIQDVFAEIAEVGSVVADTDGQPLTRISHACDFCKLILENENGYKACTQSWQKLAQQTDSSPEFISCHAGLEYARARIEVNEELVAILVVGQFHLDAPEPEELTERIEALAYKYHIDPNRLLKAAKSIPILDDRKIPQITKWLEKVSRTFEQISTERADLMYRLRQISAMTILEP